MERNLEKKLRNKIANTGMIISLIATVAWVAYGFHQYIKSEYGAFKNPYKTAIIEDIKKARFDLLYK